MMYLEETLSLGPHISPVFSLNFIDLSCLSVLDRIQVAHYLDFLVLT